jgi:hypothetical protein
MSSDQHLKILKFIINAIIVTMERQKPSHDKIKIKEAHSTGKVTCMLLPFYSFMRLLGFPSPDFQHNPAKHLESVVLNINILRRNSQLSNFTRVSTLVANKKQEGFGGWQMIGIGFGPWVMIDVLLPFSFAPTCINY